MLKPIDHQNIVIRIIGFSALTPAHITLVAQSYGLPLNLDTIATTCHHLRDESVLKRQPSGAFALTGLGEVCLANTPPIDSYYVPSAQEEIERNDAMFAAIQGESHAPQ